MNDLDRLAAELASRQHGTFHAAQVPGLTERHARHQGVERMVDDALVHNRITIASLTRVFISLAGRGRAGTTLMRELIDARSDDYVPTESELEDLFLSFVEHHSLPEPRRQVSLGSSDAFIGRVDFVYEEARLVVEVDGRAFHAQMSVQRSDRLRELKLMAAGWQVVRLGWRELIDEPTSIARSLSVILDRGVRLLRTGTEASAHPR